MPPTVIMIRHAEAVHSQYLRDFTIHDPGLTERGLSQCRELGEFLQSQFPLAQTIDLIITSPLTRTLQTTQTALGWLIDRDVPVLLAPEWQETTDKPCDRGSDPADLAAMWPQFDWDAIDPVFPAKTGLYEYSDAGLARRLVTAKRWLRARPESTVAVVSHAGFLRRATGTRFGNADFRVFDFADGGGEDERKACLDGRPQSLLNGAGEAKRKGEGREGKPGMVARSCQVEVLGVGENLPVDPELVMNEWSLTEVNGGGMGKSPRASELAVLDDGAALRKGQFLGVQEPAIRPKSR